MIFSSDPVERHFQIIDYVDKITPTFCQAIYKVSSAAENLYLDGIKISDVIQQKFLVQLGKEAGHGLCYEAAALAMLLLKDNPTARFLQGTAKRSESGERTDHAWVEFEENGVPFAVDLTWFDKEFCLPRIVHVDICESLVYFTCDYQRFWQMSMSQKLYSLCHNKKTSFVAPWLFSYRSKKNEYGLELANLSESLCHSKFAPTGEKGQFMYFMEHILDNCPNYFPIELKHVAA